MSTYSPSTTVMTHEVINQPPPLTNYNLFEVDLPLQEALEREGAAWATELVSDFGQVLGRSEVLKAGRDANRNPPEFIPFDRFGHRIDQVEYHPSYHLLMGLAKSHGVHSIAWNSEKSGGHVAHSAMEYLLGQVESGVCCPLTMTYAVVPAIQAHSELQMELFPKLTSTGYDSRFLPISQKESITMGMAMTEKQGGSDVRANSTVARHIISDEYLLTGHKWFCSAPMSDAFLTLAQTEKGLSCFFVPRWTPDEKPNPFHIQRLKDKLGNRSNASSEIEYQNTWARMIGEPGRGISTIIEMVHHTRLDCAHAAVGLMRQSITQALHHSNHRRAFGKRLIEQPLMRNVLSGLLVEYEAALMMVMRIARAYDEGTSDPASAQFARVAVAAAKYWTNKRCSYVVNESMECLGGAGYVEESILPRLYREAPLNGIWEGSGNVICLDVLRAFQRESGAVELFLAELEKAKGFDKRYDASLADLKSRLFRKDNIQLRARRITEQMALCLQGSLMIRHGSPAVRDAFIRTRFGKEGGLAFGTLPSDSDFSGILQRGWPVD